MIKKMVILLTMIAFSAISKLSAQSVDTATVVISGGQAIAIAIPKTVLPGGRVVSRSVGSPNNYQQLGIINRQSSFSAFKNIVGDTLVNALKKIKKVSSDAALWNLIETNASYKEFGMALVNLKFLKAMGWAYFDNTINKFPAGTKLYYKIADAATGITDTGSCVTGRQPGDIAPQLVNKQSGDSLIYLRWGYKKPKTAFLSRYAYVYLKNSPAEFQRQSFYAYGTVSADSVYFSMVQHVKPGQEFTYFIQPIDFFNNPVNVHSDTVSMISVDFSRIPPVEKVKAVDTTTGILLSWKRKAPNLFLTSVLIQRAESVDGRYSKLIEVALTDSIYLDRNVIAGRQYYYRLKVNGQDEPPQHRNNFSGYASANHSAKYRKPDAPYNLQVQPVANGIKLSWDTVSDSATAGYFVYRSGSSDSTKMLQISKLITGNTYMDTTKDQSRRINYSYAVKTVNLADIKSNYSNLVQAKLPNGTDGPVTPAFISARRGEGNVVVEWQNTKIADNYIKGYILYQRKLAGGDRLEYDVKKQASGEAKRLGFKRVSAEIIPSSEYSIPIMGNDSSRYAYAVSAVDVAGLESGLSTLAIESSSENIVVAPAQLNALNIDKKVQLKWLQANTNGVKGYIIYRKENSEKGFKRIAALGNKDSSYLDATVEARKIYIYKIHSVGKGGESKDFAAKAIIVE